MIKELLGHVTGSGDLHPWQYVQTIQIVQEVLDAAGAIGGVE